MAMDKEETDKWRAFYKKRGFREATITQLLGVMDAEKNRERLHLELFKMVEEHGRDVVLAEIGAIPRTADEEGKM